MCMFDFSGALISSYVMLIVLIAVIGPMLLVILMTILIRICCPRLIRTRADHQLVIKPTILDA